VVSEQNELIKPGGAVMIFSYAARIYLMMMDHKVSFREAFYWICRRAPKNMQNYYRIKLVHLLSAESGVWP
jgi:hypothetical protein